MANTSVSGNKFKIKIEKEKSQTTIYFSQRDSIAKLNSKESLLLDSIRTAISKSKKISNDIFNLVDSLVHRNEYYSMDTIVLENHHKIIQHINSVYYASDEQLENKNTIDNNGTPVRLDGTSIKLEISDKQSYRKIGIWSPRENTHPLIYNLISKILEYYRSLNPKILISKQDSSGY